MKFATRITTLFAALALTAGATSALAHGDAPHPDALKATHGGQLGVAAVYSYELVVLKETSAGQDSSVMVYVTDHAGQKIPTLGAAGTATILAGKQKSNVTLQPDGDNRMKGSGKFMATPDMKVLISITLAGKQPEQTRFTPLAVAKDGHSDHTH